MPLVLNGTTGVQDNSGAFVLGTAVASTSGTSIDFTSIPSWVKRITVMCNNVSTNGGSTVQIQLGTSGGVDTTSTYLGVSQNIDATNISNSTNNSTGLKIVGSISSGIAWNGSTVLTLLGSNTWTYTSLVARTDYTGQYMCSGAKSLSGTLTTVRITTVNGTDAFDAGLINILYE
jgi:hypothetical protein